MKTVADHLMHIARHERAVENERIRLNELPYFWPEAALRRVTDNSMRRPNSEDIQRFLKQSGYNVGHSDAKALVDAYDSDSDGVLHIIEFHFMIISGSNSVLRDRLAFNPRVP
jgi:hypothetical protein